jgi:hypothetical protein
MQEVVPNSSDRRSSHSIRGESLKSCTVIVLPFGNVRGLNGFIRFGLVITLLITYASYA